MKKLLTVAAVLLPLATSAQYEPVGPAYGGEGGRRSPWYIGFGLGTGNGNLRFASGTHSFKEQHESLWGTSVDPTNFAFNFKVGATLSPTLLVGFDVTAVRSQFDDGNFTSGIQVNNYDAVVTWFPQGEGFFVRGGAGLSAWTENVDTPLFLGDSIARGFNVLAGVGYAFWLGPTFNLTVNADYSLQSYGSSSIDPESSSFWALWVGFDWY